MTHLAILMSPLPQSPKNLQSNTPSATTGGLQSSILVWEAVSHAEVDRLVAELQSVIGAEGGARMTGGGFGGAVVAVFHRSRAPAVQTELAQAWHKRGLSPPLSFLAEAHGGAGPVWGTGP